ncbi:CPCC family cysteine-rich protein [Noviherbaspirillum sp. CPCC 100848]|uniref:CPCC family cysteine-rich protein n=1 Tax=Noviherbaspirillum album TaxID=3080276 RepID=A0ABU6JJS5_9BURK|nr:CPCC family cysteine-rich protein [Noviherbaspirillum sp. CPCC 100848]MEC4723926.1 CPCC family cysteine-rich protein [Noviherbaspirillum sp. CPCC 100848]
MNQLNQEFYPCPCCGNKTIGALGSYEICEICGWEDDPVQSSDPTFEGGANQENLITAQKIWLEKSHIPESGLSKNKIK